MTNKANYLPRQKDNARESWIHPVMPPNDTEGKKINKRIKSAIIKTKEWHTVIPSGFEWWYKTAYTVNIKAQTVPRIIQLIS